METVRTQARPIRRIVGAESFPMGPFTIKQPLPTAGLDQVSPFVLLHHAGPDHHTPGKEAQRLGAHPHRGFEPVTFLFSGGLLHRDSLGNEGKLRSGDVQWMTSGSGILHSEGPSPEFLAEGGDMELIQLWVNLPRAHKMVAPRYQDIRSTDMPRINSADGKLHLQLVAGQMAGQQGPAHTFTPILAAMGWAEAGATHAFDLPDEHNALFYLLDGAARVNGQAVPANHMVEFGTAGSGFTLEMEAPGKFLLLAGEPIHEPVASHGPFVMNTVAELQEAFRDYQLGRFGQLHD